jgi:hypothetical protein
MQSVTFSLVLFVAGVSTLRDSPSSTDAETRTDGIVGDWASGVRETEWGEMIIEMSFRKDGRFEYRMRPVPPNRGGTITAGASYSLKENGELTITVLDKTKRWQADVRSESLVIHYGDEPPLRLTRKSR